MRRVINLSELQVLGQRQARRVERAKGDSLGARAALVA